MGDIPAQLAKIFYKPDTEMVLLAKPPNPTATGTWSKSSCGCFPFKINIFLHRASLPGAACALAKRCKAIASRANISPVCISSIHSFRNLRLARPCRFALKRRGMFECPNTECRYPILPKQGQE